MPTEEIKAQKKGLIKPEKRVLINASNRYDPKSIRVNPKHWKKPGDNRYANFIIYRGWKHWKKNPNWLYLPESYIKYKNEILAELLEKIGDKDGQPTYKWEREPYYVSRNRNRQITAHFCNKRRLELLKPDIVLFFGGKEWDPEKDQEHAEYGKRPWKEEPMLYFFDNADYADNEKMYIEARASKDNLWEFTGNYYNSAGYGDITKAFIGHEHQNHTLGREWANNTELKEGKSTVNQIIPNCPACEDCFDFCDDLRSKRATEGGYKRTQIAQWQPEFGMLYTYLKGEGAGNCSYYDIKVKDAQGQEQIQVRDVPNNLHLQKWTGHGNLKDFWNTGMPAILYLVSKTHAETASKGAYDPEDNSKNTYYQELPEIYNEQPHLLNHSTIQLYFQKKLLFTANGRHLSIDRKITDRSNGKPIYVLHYQVYIRSSVAGILYQFQSGDIFFKWEVEVKGSITNQSILGGMLKAMLTSTLRNIGGTLLKMGSKIPFVGGLFDAAGDSLKEKKPGKASINDAITGEKFEKVVGTEQTLGKNEDKKSEQHTERKGKSTHKAKNLIPEPSLFATDTIDFNYDLWEFSNRAQSPTFLIRFEHSEVLYNNLTNNANQYSAPIRSIATPFKHFKELITPGFIQGEIDLDWDTDDGFFAGLIRRGIPFIKSKDDFFRPFKYRYRGLSSYTAKSVSGIDTGQGEEEVEEINKTEDTKLIDFDPNKAVAGYHTYFRTDTPELYTALCVGQFSSHKTGPGGSEGRYVSSSPNTMNPVVSAVCWGCGLDRSKAHEIQIGTGGTIYTYFDGAAPAETAINVPDNCLLVIDPPGNAIFTRIISSEFLYKFKAQRQDAERDEEIAEYEFEDTTHDPTNTSGEVEIDEDDDEDKEELDLDDDDLDAEQEQEEDEEAEVDSDYDDDIEDDDDEESDLDTEIDEDDDSDEEEDSDEDEEEDEESDTEEEDDDDEESDKDDDQDKG